MQRTIIKKSSDTYMGKSIAGTGANPRIIEYYAQLIGHLREGNTQQILSHTKKLTEISKKRNGKHMYAGTISTRNQSGEAQWDGSTTLISNAIDANYFKGPDNHRQRTMIISDSGKGRKKQLQSKVIPPLRANTGAGHNNIIIHSLFPRSGDPKKGGIGHISKKDGTTYCIDAANTLAIEKESQVRRLMPIEVEKLQGFPPEWTAKGINDQGKEVIISDAQRYKTLGNAVTTNVIQTILTHSSQFIAESILNKSTDNII